MNWLDILQKGSGDPVGNLDTILQFVAEGGSPLADEALKLRTKFNDQMSGADLAATAAACANELADIKKGHIHPRQHPSDGFGG